MNRDHIGRHLLIVFLLSLGFYVAGYWFIESRRVAHTPWAVTFQADDAGHPEIEIRQQSMNLGPIRIRLDTTNLVSAVPKQEVLFDQPKAFPFNVPLGQCIFQDATFMPGTVVLEISGVKIQMLPRSLTIGTNEFAWTSNALVIVSPDGSARAMAPLP